MTKLVRSVRASDTTQAALNIHVVRGETRSGQETGLEKHYDPQWIAPLTFLEEVQTRGMLKANIENAGLGDLVILPGTLNMVDMRSFQKAFETLSGMPSAPTPARGNRKERRSGQIQSPAPPFDPAMGLRLIASLDQPIFMLFSAASGKFWSTLDQESIVCSSTDLHLKHGITIGGEWQLIGILDCLPGETVSSTIPRFCGDGVHDFSDGLGIVLRELRIIMGRPSDCYGITPLIIMREVT